MILEINELKELGLYYDLSMAEENGDILQEGNVFYARLNNNNVEWINVHQM